MALRPGPLELVSASPEESLTIGRAVGRALAPGDVVGLIGDLGAGKTWLTKGIAHGLGVAPEEVTSPTFVLMHMHQGRLSLAHFDAYRLGRGAELLDLGAEETFFGDGVTVVEWADRVADVLPADRLEIALEATGEQERTLRVAALGPKAAKLLERLRAGGTG